MCVQTRACVSSLFHPMGPGLAQQVPLSSNTTSILTLTPYFCRMTHKAVKQCPKGLDKYSTSVD